MDERSRRPQLKAQRLASRAAQERARAHVPTKSPRRSKLAFGAEPGLVGRIRLAMIKKGYDRAELARRIGSSRAAVYGWFDRGHLPSDKYLPAIAEALDVPLEWLLTGDPLLRTKGR